MGPRVLWLWLAAVGRSSALDVNVTVPSSGQAPWLRIGEPAPPVWQLIGNALDVLHVHIVAYPPQSTTPPHPPQLVWFGTDPRAAVPPWLLRTVFQPACRPWWPHDRTAPCVAAQLPRYGPWAPWGFTHIRLADHAAPGRYVVRYHVEHRPLARGLRALAGVALLLGGRVCSHWRPAHLVMGALVGGMGLSLLLGYGLLRLTAGHRGARGALLALGVGLSYCSTLLQAVLWQHMLDWAAYYLLVVITGALTGLAAAYRWPMAPRSQTLLLALLRLTGVLLLMTSVANRLVVGLGILLWRSATWRSATWWSAKWRSATWWSAQPLPRPAPPSRCSRLVSADQYHMECQQATAHGLVALERELRRRHRTYLPKLSPVARVCVTQLIANR